MDSFLTIASEYTHRKVERKREEKTVSVFFESNPDTDVTFGDFLSFGNEDYFAQRKKPNANLSDLKYTFELCHPTVFVKRSAYEKFGLFSLDYKLAMDYELLSKMYYGGAKFIYINEIISCYRDGGVSQTLEKGTLKEHKKIAVRNGCTVSEINNYFRKRKMRGFIIKALKMIGIFYWLRKKIKPAEIHNAIWWEE